MNALQEGIYFDKDVPESFGIIFIRVKKDAKAANVAREIAALWDSYMDLKRGIVDEVPESSKNIHTGNLSVLIGFGPDIFSLDGIKLSRPPDFPGSSIFFSPSSAGGGPLLEGSNLTYAKHIVDNDVADNEIAIQLIADTEFAINRAILKTWENLTRESRKNEKGILFPTRFYKGHNRPDRRNWLGFLDGISNMNDADRRDAIFIADNKVDKNTKWTVGGTYLAFIRIIIDVVPWWEVPRSDQEIMVGREKSSGCPIIGIDRNGGSVKDTGCPIYGTSEITEVGNERFRDHPQYGNQRTLPPGVTDGLLRYSHAGSVRRRVDIPARNAESFRIYRQGFEFLESSDNNAGLKVGLNFVSFQNSPQRIIGTLANSFGIINQYFSVESSGLFFIPPVNKMDKFPGSSIFPNPSAELKANAYSAGLYKP